MKKQPQITAATKENFVSAFWMLYRKNRIEQISINEIAKAAGYNRATFYRYFTDVYDVLNYLEDNLLVNLKETIANSFNSIDDSDIIHKVADLYDSQGEYLSVLISENGDPQFVKKLKAVIKPTISSALSIKEQNVYLDCIFEFAMSAILGTITYWYQHKSEIPSNEIVPMLRSMLAKGAFQELQKHLL